MEGLERLLAEHPFFDGTNAADISLVVGCARNVRFTPGQYLFREGEPADRFYVVREGRVSLEVYAPAKGAIVIDTAGAGEERVLCQQALEALHVSARPRRWRGSPRPPR